jgi:hypothetical protein
VPHRRTSRIGHPSNKPNTRFRALGCCLLALLASPAAARAAPYEGLWSASPRTCRTDTDGVHRLEINPNGLFWYEERCRGRIRPAGRNAWRAELACEGEGMRQRVTTRLLLPSPDRLVLENAPVTPVKRHAYVRCAAR